jgi:hypothetical protein
VTLRHEDRREIARQLFSRPPTALPRDPAAPFLVCTRDRLSGLCLAGAVAGHVAAREGRPWRVFGDEGANGSTPLGDGYGPLSLPERAVLSLADRDGADLRRAALVARATIIWCDGSEAGTAGGLRLALHLQEEAGAPGPVSLLGTRSPPGALRPWLAEDGAVAGRPLWGGVWRPGDPLPAPLRGQLAALC